eukprot:scaffold258218_cov33-Tisochrysis_lutea.AAC.2
MMLRTPHDTPHYIHTLGATHDTWAPTLDWNTHSMLYYCMVAAQQTLQCPNNPQWDQTPNVEQKNTSWGSRLIAKDRECSNAAGPLISQDCSRGAGAAAATTVPCGNLPTDLRPGVAIPALPRLASGAAYARQARSAASRVGWLMGPRYRGNGGATGTGPSPATRFDGEHEACGGGGGEGGLKPTDKMGAPPGVSPPCGMSPPLCGGSGARRTGNCRRCIGCT